MSDLFDLSNFDKYKEDNCREVKKAEGGLPIALWESYSSFANSNGGVIILGVGERQDGTWYTTGLKNADKLKRNFWNTIHDTKKVSINLLSEKNVESYEVNGDKKPFKLEGITRVDDTPVHKAVREALVNCLVNTDYFLPCGVVIKKEDDKLVIENPGSIRTGKKQMLRGGISDPRNKTLMKMFNMIGIGERAGSGIPDIYQVWENEGWPMPVVEESYNPDRTRLSLEFAKKQTIKTIEEEKEPKRSQKGAEKEPIKGAERKKEILKLIKVNSTITQVEIMKELDLTRKQVQKDMKELQEMHIIAREGTNRRGRWIIVKENK